MAGKFSSYTAKTPVVDGDQFLITDNDSTAISKLVDLSVLKTYVSNAPTLVTPALGTPASGVLTSCTGLPIAGLASGTDGELITWDASGNAAAVAVGTAGHVLTSGGVGVAPTFQAASGGVVRVIETKELSVASSSMTFTISPAIDFDDDSYVILEVDGNPTLILGLLLEVNGYTTNGYYSEGQRTSGGTITVLDENNSSGWTIGSTSVLGAVNNSFVCRCEIGINKGGNGASQVWRLLRSNIVGLAQINEQKGGECQTASSQTTLNEVKILTSTSTLQIGTRATLYAVSRS